MNKDQKQNIFDLRGQNVEQDSVILNKNNFDNMLSIVKRSLTKVSMFELKESVKELMKDCENREQLVTAMSKWLDEQQFLDWVTGLGDDELKPSTSTEIIDYPPIIVDDVK